MEKSGGLLRCGTTWEMEIQKRTRDSNARGGTHVRVDVAGVCESDGGEKREEEQDEDRKDAG